MNDCESKELDPLLVEWEAKMSQQKSTRAKYKPHWRGFVKWMRKSEEFGGLHDIGDPDWLLQMTEAYVDEQHAAGRTFSHLNQCVCALQELFSAVTATNKLRAAHLKVRSHRVKGLLKNARHRGNELKYDGSKDYASFLPKMLSIEERKRVMIAMSPLHAMAFSLCFQTLMRGDSLRECSLAGLSFTWYEESGPDPLPYLRILTKHKNSGNMLRLHGACRHLDVELCALGATCRYLVWRFDILGEALPDFLSPNRAWYDASKLYPVTDRGMYAAFKKVSDELGLDLGKVTHMREFGARYLETLPYINEEDITRLGKWLDGGDGGKVSSVARTNYFTNVAHKAMVAAGGHSEYTNVCIPRQHEQPHPELLKKIFPGLEEVTSAVVNRTDGVKDEAALLFLRTLELARVVFLQDCALLHSTQGTSNPVFGHPVFKCPYWSRFKTKVARAQSSRNMRPHDTLSQSFMHMFTQHSVAVDHKLKELNDEVRECKSMIAKLSEGPSNNVSEVTRRRVAHAIKPPPHPPTNCKQFSSLYDLWQRLTNSNYCAAHCSYMEAEEHHPGWRKDPPTQSSRRKFWMRLKRLHEYVTAALEHSSEPDVLEALEQYMKAEKIGLGSLLQRMESSRGISIP